MTSPPAPSRREGGSALVAGLVLAVMVIAFEATAVVTVMPTIADELDGDALYGVAFAAFMLANLVSSVVSAELADRRGPAASFALGVACFAAGLAVAGLAPSMPVLVLGRALQGTGAGGLATTAYVTIGRGFPPERQPKLFAWLSTGWVLPSLVAPAAAGFAAEQWGWRWVFLGLFPLLVVLVALVAPTLRELGPPPAGPEQADSSRVPAAVALAAGTAVLLAGLQIPTWSIAVVVVATGGVVMVRPLLRLLPAGTVAAATGLPAAVASRFLVNVAFFGADTFLPLAASRIHGASATTAGLVIIGGALAWTAGAALSARGPREAAARKVVGGFALLAVGIAGVTPIVASGFPLWAVFLLWSVGGLGIGMVFNTTSVAALGNAPAGREGLVSSQLQIVDSLGFALAAGLGGALVTLADRGVLGLPAALATVFVASAGVAVLGMAAGRGVRQSKPREATARV